MASRNSSQGEQLAVEIENWAQWLSALKYEIAADSLNTPPTIIIVVRRRGLKEDAIYILVPHRLAGKPIFVSSSGPARVFSNQTRIPIQTVSAKINAHHHSVVS
ncbi:hypothetical protein RRG08_023664 [Elysia crispata]|uniref:Uncharacterized protein n=1 Tax=Elysia crispata TaxID=231223 RepID=A0AAE0XSM6_9GAST|nr:hypothetical protein RRG08_023664 [Elysia crispata]